MMNLAFARWRCKSHKVDGIERYTELVLPSRLRVGCRGHLFKCSCVLAQGLPLWNAADGTLHIQPSCLEQHDASALTRCNRRSSLCWRRKSTCTNKRACASASAGWQVNRQRQLSFSNGVREGPCTVHPICIVGAGPSGFYCAKALLQQWKQLQDATSLTHKQDSSRHVKPDTDMRNVRLNIVLLDALPSPYGLVRCGVAPDHPEVKAVANRFDEVC